MQPNLESSYQTLPDRFYARTEPSPVREPALIRLNSPLAQELGLDANWLASADGIAMLAGNAVPQGARPVALAYAGHQFGQFVPQLGDGRAVLLGEVVDVHGRRRDIQLKGSGRTAYSRGGDGRAALGPVLREYVVSEAMAALGIPTTRALAAVTTGEHVYREARLPGAVLARVAASHIRIGTFQFFAARGDVDGVRALADHAIARHYPQAQDEPQPYLALLRGVLDAQAHLVARWMLVGFIHGVMNTDNMSISGETIDYGPCAFIDAYDPATVFSSIDQFGRYAFANQPHIAQWNLTRFAEALLPLLDEDQDRAVELAQDALSAFSGIFEAEFRTGMRAKLGLRSDQEGDIALAKGLLDAMAKGQADFTLVFRSLADDVESNGDATRTLFSEPALYDTWSNRWRARLDQDPSAEPAERAAAMRAVSPIYIPRNHQVETVIQAAVERGDFGPFEQLVEVLSNPFEVQPGRKAYANPPRPDERVLQTFCGT